MLAWLWIAVPVRQPLIRSHFGGHPFGAKLDAMSTSPPLAGLESLPPELGEAASNAWIDICTASPEAASAMGTMQDREAVARILATSHFIARWCASNPVELVAMIERGDFQRSLDGNEITERTRQAIADCDDEASLMRELRRLRIREWVRIGWRDLAGAADLAEVIATLSGFADACVHLALEQTASHMNVDPRGFFVLGMGKLGGGELNFSSDIDIMFAVEGETEPERSQLRLAQTLTKVLGATTADGFVFRVDTRLRPHGKAGPIIFSTDAMEHYYQTHGRDWERYALTKARPIAGDIEAGKRFLRNIRPFVYRKYLDFGAFEAIRSMHAMIDGELEKKGINNDVKRGRGGIRQIEFMAQSQQLLRGGREQALQTPKLVQALSAICDLGELDGQTRDQLYADYCFLRRIEHRLQIVADEQTHAVPDDDYPRLRLAIAMDFSDVQTFDQEFERVRSRVDSEFKATFRIDADEPAVQGAWITGDLDHDLTLFEQAGYDDPAEASRISGQFLDGAMVQSLSAEGRQRLDTLMPLLITQCASSTRPSQCLGEVIKLLELIGRRPTYFSALIEYPVALQQVVALCDASPWLGHWLGTNPMLLDELLEPIAEEAVDATTLHTEIDRELAGIDADDTEAVMHRLREYRHSQVFRVAARALRLEQPVRATTESLTRIADVIIDRVRESAIEMCRARLPQSIVDDPKLCVIGYGKLGSLDMGYTSDIDIVFLYDDGGEYDGDVAAGYARIAQRMISLLTTRLASGLLYEVDVRLRPSGSKGLLVSSLDAFSNYQTTDAWTFEHQALVRARPICGNEDVARSFEQIRQSILGTQRDATTLSQDVKQMREKMISANDASDEELLDLKLGRGALVDIEFIVQYGVLLHTHSHRALAGSTDTVWLIQQLAEVGMLDSSEAADLVTIFEFYLGEINRLRMMELPAVATSDDIVHYAKRVTEIWQRLMKVDANI